MSTEAERYAFITDPTIVAQRLVAAAQQQADYDQRIEADRRADAVRRNAMHPYGGAPCDGSHMSGLGCDCAYIRERRTDMRYAAKYGR